MAKNNNNHKYPEANKQPKQKAAARIGGAQGRQEAYNELTLEQKIACLPPEPGAKKERAKLMKQLDKRNAKAEAEKVVAAQKEAGQVQTQ